MATKRHLPRITIAANASLAYPFVAIGALCGCWLIAHRILGHAPIYLTDDPEITFGRAKWLYVAVSYFVFLGMVPAFLASVAFSVSHVVVTRPSAAQAGIRAITTAAVWLWFWRWIVTDPHGIINWWMD